MPLRCTISSDVTSCLKGKPVQSLVPSHPVTLCPNLGIIAKKIKIKTNHCPQLLPIRDYHQTYRQRNISGHSNHFASTLQPGLILGSSIHQGPDAGSLKLTSLYLQVHHQVHQQTAAISSSGAPADRGTAKPRSYERRQLRHN